MPACGAGAVAWGNDPPTCAVPSCSAAPRLARLSILADLHIDLSPDGDLQLITSYCRPTVEVQSAEEVGRSARGVFWHGIWVNGGTKLSDKYFCA